LTRCLDFASACFSVFLTFFMSTFMEPFPFSAPEFNGDCRTVPVGNAFEWLKQGWAIFMANPGIWLAISVIFFLIYIGISIVPLIGPLAAHLLTPVLGGGWLLACQKVSKNGTLEITDLFAGFKQNANNLVVLGILYMVGLLAVLAAAAVLGGGGLVSGMVLGNVPGFGLALGGMMLAVMVSLALSIPLMMAMWFAPALVVFNNMQPVPALKASFNACIKNVVAFLVFDLVIMVLCFFAALPLGLGFLVLLPVFVGALYASYRDIFVAN
jgi:uncharacterized membrane protein